MKKKIINAILIIMAVAIVIFVTGGVVSVLWNELMPVIFGLPNISIYQSVELTLLIYALTTPINLGINKDK